MRPHASRRSRRGLNSGQGGTSQGGLNSDGRTRYPNMKQGNVSSGDSSPLTGTSASTSDSESGDTNSNTNENDGTRSMTGDSLGSLSDLNF